MTSPHGRTPHPDDPAEGPDDDPGQDAVTDPHPDSRGSHPEDPAEGPDSLPS